MTWYRFCWCRHKSLPLDAWREFEERIEDRYEASGYRVHRSCACEPCLKQHGSDHRCSVINHPVEDEVFGPLATRKEVKDAGWELPGAWRRKLHLQNRRTLLLLRGEGLLRSWVFNVHSSDLCRAYSAFASLDALHEAVSRYEPPPSEMAVKLTYRRLLEAAGVSYRVGTRHAELYRRSTGLIVPRWVACVLLVTPMLGGRYLPVFDPDDRRPYWQKKRLFRLAAFRWALADSTNREALEALAMNPKAVWQVMQFLAVQLKVDKTMPYEFDRLGERTRERASRK